MALVGVAVSRCSKASDDPVAIVAMGSDALALTIPTFCHILSVTLMKASQDITRR